MKVFKRWLAAMLAAALMVPAQPVMAKPLPVEAKHKEGGYLTASSSDAEEDTGAEKLLPGSLVATSSNTTAKTPKEEVIFNTGNHDFRVVSSVDYLEKGLGDAFFEEDGSFIINIPEENPFFPYEVQFTHKGTVTTEWFMTPDDSVDVGGHTFYVSAFFDGSAVTQMSLEIAGDTVIVYPERKKFRDDGGAMTMSLLPLKERYLNVDMSDYTPVELTMVSLKSIFAGDNELKDTDQVIWTYWGDDSFTVNSSGDILDLSYGMSYGNSKWEMIVGENDQLAGSNIRYYVSLNVQDCDSWLIPTLCKEEDNNRTDIQVLESRYGDYYFYYNEYDSTSGRNQHVWVPSTEVEYGDSIYVELKLNPAVFENPKFAQIKVYEGNYRSAEKAMEGIEITDQIYDVHMTDANTGYLLPRNLNKWITMVTFDADGEVTGCLPFHFVISRRTYQSSIFFDLAAKTEDGWGETGDTYDRYYSEGCFYNIYTLYRGYPADGLYYLQMSYFNGSGIHDDSKVTAVFAGRYASIADAIGSGAKNIRKDLLDSIGEEGYAADFSKGVYFTIFVGEDGAEDQETHYCYIKAEEGSIPLSGDTMVEFYGLLDKDGSPVKYCVIDNRDDSYAEYNYLTILAGEDVDLTSLAPQFSLYSGLHLYAEGGSSPEISGKSLHDFSNGPVQYTASAENGMDAMNYWLQVIKAESEEGRLYINSLEDENAKTSREGGVIYSTREALLDGLHDYAHDILIINTGKEGIDSLSAELVSDEVELDEYWTLKGKYQLSGFNGANESLFSGLENLAKIRLKARKDVEPGEDVSGTLTIKSGDAVLMVLTLTGTVGDPSIITTEIPEAVKYVPYGTMIQNSNKYSWNKVSYSLSEGQLPAGMELKPNGELYGVPSETGTFTFTVSLDSHEDSFSSSERSFTLVVNENTDANVEAATDQGYQLTQRVQDISLDSSSDQTMVSEGIYAEFVNLFLDGAKLQEGIDYDSESGSTRITIRSQTLKKSNNTGTHTLGIEFRTKDTKDLKRAAQNYVVTGSDNSSDDNNDNSSSGSSRSSSVSNKTTLTRDPKKGYMDPQRGIITGEGDGYSRWQQDEQGWKLIYADNTAAAGYMTEGPDGAAAEQVVWERVNGFWYAFGANEYLKSGWIYDYQLTHWYYMSVENGMKSGWLDETQDGCTYYLEPANGQLVTGWRQIDGKWYYFSEALAAPTWLYDVNTGNWLYDEDSKIKPFGAMYRNERTPDGYMTGSDGVWDGIEK